MSFRTETPLLGQRSSEWTTRRPREGGGEAISALLGRRTRRTARAGLREDVLRRCQRDRRVPEGGGRRFGGLPRDGIVPIANTRPSGGDPGVPRPHDEGCAGHTTDGAADGAVGMALVGGVRPGAVRRRRRALLRTGRRTPPRGPPAGRYPSNEPFTLLRGRLGSPNVASRRWIGKYAIPRSDRVRIGA